MVVKSLTFQRTIKRDSAMSKSTITLSGNSHLRFYLLIDLSRFLKLGLQGHSIFYASGDDGVAGPPGDDSANGCLGPNHNIFSPAWPNRWAGLSLYCPFTQSNHF